MFWKGRFESRFLGPSRSLNPAYKGEKSEEVSLAILGGMGIFKRDGRVRKRVP